MVAQMSETAAGNRRFRPLEAAAYTGYALSTLANWRSQNDGPRYTKAPGHKECIYEVADLDPRRKAVRKSRAAATVADSPRTGAELTMLKKVDVPENQTAS